MEGGSPFLEYLTYGIVGLVLCALGLLALRTAWFFLSLLAIPVTEAASRWGPAARALERWGERGARRDPTTWRERPSPVPIAVVSGARVPASVRRGVVAGALLGALPGVWLGIRGALHTLRAGGSVGEAAAAVGIALGLVAAAGTIVGTGVGAGVGIAWDAVRGRRA